jgi:hypothetical protein
VARGQRRRQGFARLALRASADYRECTVVGANDDPPVAGKQRRSSGASRWLAAAGPMRVMGLLAAVAAAAILIVGILWSPLGFHLGPFRTAGGPSSPSQNLPSLTLPIRAALY